MQIEDVKRGNTVLFVLMLAAFSDTLGAFLVLALLPYYASDLGANAFDVGWLVASFAVAQTLTAPLWGRLSDRIGRRPVILLGLGILVVSFATFAFADSLGILLLSRLAQGVGGGTVSVTFALISDVSKAHQTALRIGWLTAATSGAALVGPLLGSLLVPIAPEAPGLVAAVFCLLSLLLAWRLLPAPRTLTVGKSPLGTEVSPGAENAPPGQGSNQPSTLLGSLFSVLLHPRRFPNFLIWTYVAGMFGTNAVLAVVGLFLELRHDIGATEIWQFFALLAGASLVLRIALLPLALARFGERRVMLHGTWVLGLSLMAIALAGGFWVLALATVAMAAGQSLLYPATTGLISLTSSEDRRGAVLGVQQTWGGVARILGPLVAGGLYGLRPELPFFGAGLILILWAGLVAWRLRLERQT